MASVNDNTPKQEILSIIQDQPDDSTFDELLRELACRRAVRNGLQDVDRGNTVSNEEAYKRIKSWRS